METLATEIIGVSSSEGVGGRKLYILPKITSEEPDQAQRRDPGKHEHQDLERPLRQAPDDEPAGEHAYQDEGHEQDVEQERLTMNQAQPEAERHLERVDQQEEPRAGPDDLELGQR